MKRILLLGATGFLGYHVYKSLEKDDYQIALAGYRHANRKPIPAFNSCDLRESNETFDLFHEVKPDYIINCAGWNGGISWNMKFPAQVLDFNLRMACNIYQASMHAYRPEKIVNVISSCCYPDGLLHPMTPNELYNGPCNGTIRAHGFARKAFHECSIAYGKQYGLHSVTLCLTNLFGPYDTFNLDRTKVAAALIRKLCEAKERGDESVTFFGTGRPRRELMDVRDAAQAVRMALSHYDSPELLNVGTGIDHTLRDIVEEICKQLNYHPTIHWDKTKQDGQMVKQLDSGPLRKLWNKHLPTKNLRTLSETIQDTIQFFNKHRDALPLN
jgi:GDP-L-fucose synthase